MQGAPTRISGLALSEKIESIAKRLPSRRFQIVAGAALLGILLAIVLNSGGGSHPAAKPVPQPRHPAAVDHIPGFIASPGSPDILLGVMAVVLAGAVLATGVLFFWLHSLPERLVHKSTKLHLDIVAVLALLSLFTHIHLFWVAALLIALVKVPDFSFLSRHLQSMTTSLGRIADAQAKESERSPTIPAASASDDERKPC
jgi:multisubunit Na+/H+ antiporter MnhF subunit